MILRDIYVHCMRVSVSEVYTARVTVKQPFTLPDFALTDSGRRDALGAETVCTLSLFLCPPRERNGQI